MQIALGSCLEHVDKPKISTQCQEEMHWFFENTWWWIRRICVSTTKPMDRCYKAQNLVPMYQSTLRNPKFILSSGEISCPSTYFFVDGRNPAPPDLYETPANCGIFTNLNWCNIFFPSTHITLVGRWADSIRLFFLGSFLSQVFDDSVHLRHMEKPQRRRFGGPEAPFFSKECRLEKTFKIKIQINCASIMKILQVTSCTKS